MENAVDITKTRDRVTIFKLIDIQCNQISDSVKNARIPFLMALTWAFAWAWSLYINEYGDTDNYAKRRIAYLVASLDVADDTNTNINIKDNIFINYCKGLNIDLASEWNNKPPNKQNCSTQNNSNIHQLDVPITITPPHRHTQKVIAEAPTNQNKIQNIYNFSKYAKIYYKKI